MIGCPHTFVNGVSTCSRCGWTLPATFTPIQLGIAQGMTGEPLELVAVKLALVEQREALCRAARSNATSMRALAEEAFKHHDAGDEEKRNYALSAALDIECETTGDCRVLGPIAEAWGIADTAIDAEENPYTPMKPDSVRELANAAVIRTPLELPEFGVHDGDSQTLLELCQAIDDGLPWPSDEAREAGVYTVAIKHAAELLRAHGLGVQS